MTVAFALPKDLDYLVEKDHLGSDTIGEKIARREFLIAYDDDDDDDRRDDRRVGFLRYNYFWDDEPFMNLLWVEEDLRSKGFGTRLISFWEEEMQKLGYESVLTSTLSTNGGAQRLYRRLGYEDSGCLLMPGEPLEILLLKGLSQET